MPTKSPRKPKRPRTRSSNSTSSSRGVKPEQADRGFAYFCKSVLTLEEGTPLEVEDFQAIMLADFFAGAQETLILIPKKNGKSTLLGALALHHLCVTEDAECVIAAASRDQAGIMLRQAQGFIRRSPSLQNRLLVKQREIVHKINGGRVRILASDVDTADGVIPTLALVDELHRHKNADLYGVFRDGLGPRNGQMVTISTAGDMQESPLGQMRDAAYELGVKRKGAYRHARTNDGAYVMHEWALPEEADRDDMAMVKQANPASWQTEKALKLRHDSPSMTEQQWARFACGLWVATAEAWLPTGAWDACLEEGAEIPQHGRVVLGVDVGRKHDRSAVVACHERGDGRTVVEAKILEQGADLSTVEESIRALAGRFTVEAVMYDPWSFARSAELLEDEGLLMVEHPQSPERMHKSSAGLYEAIVSKRIAHDGDRALRAHVEAGSTKDTERGWRLVKNPKARRPIDALIALAMANGSLGSFAPRRSRIPVSL